MQRKMRQQLLDARLVKARDGPVALKQAKQAEQVEVQACGWRFVASVCKQALNPMWCADHAHYSMDPTGSQRTSQSGAHKDKTISISCRRRVRRKMEQRVKGRTLIACLVVKSLTPCYNALRITGCLFAVWRHKDFRPTQQHPVSMQTHDL
jgi:hypothetical protein